VKTRVLPYARLANAAVVRKAVEICITGVQIRERKGEMLE
jgi:hypothetical protein